MLAEQRYKILFIQYVKEHLILTFYTTSNTVGATGGKIISPQSIAIATSAGNQQGKEGEILKAAIPYALTYVLITGIIVYIFS